MSTLDKILELIEKNNIEQQQFTSAIGIRKQSVSEWKNGTTKTYMKHIDKIANYFNVSTDYLLGKSDSPQTLDEQLSGIDFALYGEVKEMTDEEKQDILDYIRYKKSKKKNV